MVVDKADGAGYVVPMDSIGLLSVGDVRSWSVVYQWGLELVRAIQTIETPVLTALIKSITHLGSAGIFILAIALEYWCINEKKGCRLALLVIFSAWLNGALKTLLRKPRPYFLDPSVGKITAAGYGLPSGHSQLSLTFWAAALTGPLGKGRAWLVTGLITLIIAFTRLYLGVHFPTDVLGGWFLALATLGAYYFLLPPLERFLAARGTRGPMIGAAAAAFVMNALYPGNSHYGALFLGFSAGYLLMRAYFPFSAAAEAPNLPKTFLGLNSGLVVRGLRLVLGLAGTTLLFYGLKGLLGRGSLLGAGNYELSRFLHYGILSLWVSAGAPWLFLRLGLAVPQAKQKNEEKREGGI
ncbi:MAG: phosphatase PAP2 family protein [Spirochaetaceae bacterium]|nr:phosphatase PAP2 family protein [Spirochaetaceae bacterium]